MVSTCPGARQFTRPEPGYYDCPSCGAEVEIWTDELGWQCSLCGTMVYREREQSCIDYCPQARECLGEARYERLVQARPARHGASPSPETDETSNARTAK